VKLPYSSSAHDVRQVSARTAVSSFRVLPRPLLVTTATSAKPASADTLFLGVRLVRSHLLLRQYLSEFLLGLLADPFDALPPLAARRGPRLPRLTVATPQTTKLLHLLAQHGGHLLRLFFRQLQTFGE